MNEKKKSFQSFAHPAPSWWTHPRDLSALSSHPALRRHPRSNLGLRACTAATIPHEPRNLRLTVALDLQLFR